jgi:alkylhydroperoxidase family enzyme
VGSVRRSLRCWPSGRGPASCSPDREQAALALTEEITELTGRGHVSDEAYCRAAAVLSERELGQVIAMALTINAWNRIGVTTRLSPPQR